MPSIETLAGSMRICRSIIRRVVRDAAKYRSASSPNGVTVPYPGSTPRRAARTFLSCHSFFSSPFLLLGTL